MYLDTQPHTFTPSLAMLIETQTRLHARHATRGPVAIWRLVLGMGVAVLLALLCARVLLPASGTPSDAPAAAAAQSQTRSPEELEELGLAPVLFDDFLARF